MHVRDRLLTRVVRYTAIAVVAFTVGSATVVLAAGTGAMQLPVFRLADGVNPDQFAKVDAAGNVQVSVNNQPSTQQITGTVSVSNFPSTQNVNVTGGTVTTRPAVATKGIETTLLMGAEESEVRSVGPINASFIMISTTDNVAIFITGSIGEVKLMVGSGHREMTFPQRVPVSAIRGICHNIVLDCLVHVSLIGD